MRLGVSLCNIQNFHYIIQNYLVNTEPRKFQLTWEKKINRHQCQDNTIDGLLTKTEILKLVTVNTLAKYVKFLSLGKWIKKSKLKNKITDIKIYWMASIVESSWYSKESMNLKVEQEELSNLNNRKNQEKNLRCLGEQCDSSKKSHVMSSECQREERKCDNEKKNWGSND